MQVKNVRSEGGSREITVLQRVVVSLYERYVNILVKVKLLNPKCVFLFGAYFVPFQAPPALS